MRINIFEGSRRILLLLQVSWAVGALAVSWSGHDGVDAHYQTSSPIAPFIRTDSSCTSDDRSAYIYQETTKSGTDVSIDLCFKARDFGKGKMLVPYKFDSDLGFFGNTGYSNEVDDYVQTRKRSFQIPPEDEKLIDELGREKLIEGMKEGLRYAVGGWFTIWIIGTVIGWIARGFMGIPARKDARQ